MAIGEERERTRMDEEGGGQRTPSFRMSFLFSFSAHPQSCLPPPPPSPPPENAFPGPIAGPENRRAAIEMACAEFDHGDNARHSAELYLGAANVLCLVLRWQAGDNQTPSNELSKTASRPVLTQWACSFRRRGKGASSRGSTRRTRDEPEGARQRSRILGTCRRACASAGAPRHKDVEEDGWRGRGRGLGSLTAHSIKKEDSRTAYSISP